MDAMAGEARCRKCMDVDFAGFTHPERFLVNLQLILADVGYAFTNYIADPKEWCALFKVPGWNDEGFGEWSFLRIQISRRKNCLTMTPSKRGCKAFQIQTTL